MRDLTIQILTRNNEKTIKATLDSILPLNGKIIVADFGSKDQTCRIAEGCGCEIVIFSNTKKDYSRIRNDLIKKTNTKWNFYIQPFEVIAYGNKEFKEIIDQNRVGAYFAKIFRNDTVTKEIRLWSVPLQFSNPIYECLSGDMIDSNAIIYSKVQTDYEEITQQIGEWKNKFPISAEPYYYEACILLSQGKYDEFLKAAEFYLFNDKKILPVTMIRYYCALVYCHIKKNPDLTARQIVPCIIANPLMAEFWCILGDIYYFHINDYEKAIGFYENALFLGSQRLKDDPWPMEIKKYKEYPQKMKSACLAKIKNTVFYGVKCE
jgi:glycosyltransferase involved in cell wall biosynthesis